MISSTDTLSRARRTRLHRSSAARFLASLESSCSVGELESIDWHALEAVPHWCLTERSITNRLQLVCGAVLLAPLIVQWLDGKRLKQARSLVGEQYFDAALRAGASRVVTQNRQSDEPVPELLASAGASVLVGAVGHSTISDLLAKQFPMDVAVIDSNIAQSVYQLALGVIDQIQDLQNQANGAIDNQESSAEIAHASVTTEASVTPPASVKPQAPATDQSAG